ncbi:hypothetical protein NA56DRAFT_690277 [Hyaloscypha hepaticicola]|uniref:Uncharacterized protein n=1 Tax=Hyaloscypha hepaticicola TaxID=2082293 RepID=A0A2J6Q046_9HELO|nr:hypothetical protein NA56DRAFT_690277 [Hyaloscypha hepaticicola]
MAQIPSNTTAPWTDHGIPGLVCTQARWSSLILFFLANYVAHCATIMSYPAETLTERAVAVTGALLFPSSGLRRAVGAIRRRPRLRPLNSIQRALASGAMCMVVRTKDWEPRTGEIIRNLRSNVKPFADSSHSRPRPNRGLELKYIICSPPWMKEFVASEEPHDSIAERKCKIHGSYRLPEGYEFAYVPTDAVIAPLEQIPGAEQVSMELSTSNSLIKTCLAMLQTGYAAYSVYKARGDQIAVYGYAAFGLTVIPYIMMSVLNLVAQLVSDDYPMLYMIHTPEMDEAIGRGGIFQGAVAKLEPWAGGIDNDTGMVLMDSNSGPWKVEESGFTVATFQNQDVTSSRHLQRIEVYNRRIYAHGDGDVYIPCCTKFQRQGQSDNSTINSRTWRPDHQLRRRILEDKFYLLNFFWPLCLSLLPFVLLGVLSHFHQGANSTNMERGFTMSWLVAGMLFGFLFPYLVEIWQFLGTGVVVHELPLSRTLWRTTLGSIGWILVNLMALNFSLVLLVFCVPAIGGFVMVGKMILEYGSCNRV